ncbi:MAG: type II toxin-antitoxin system VapC family toxin [Mycobacteriales bacterium]|nr:type II toxin-antitoxin system VapC family toxin [Mycobacteriales bacterium]
MIVVDTNVFSELMRSAPAPQVDDWFAAQDETRLFVTAVTLAEVSYGIERLPAGARKRTILATAEESFGAFVGKVLPFDEVAARAYGAIAAEREALGLPISAMDAQIAAICRASGALLATRNTKDFEQTGVSLVDPWNAE